MILNESLKAKAKAMLGSMDFDGVCFGIYRFINEKCVPMPVGDDRDIVEAMMLKRLIDYMIKGWEAGCERAEIEPDDITEALTEV